MIPHYKVGFSFYGQKSEKNTNNTNNDNEDKMKHKRLLNRIRHL